MNEQEFIKNNQAAVSEYIAAYKSKIESKRNFQRLAKSQRENDIDGTPEAERELEQAGEIAQELSNKFDQIEISLVVAFKNQNNGHQGSIDGELRELAVRS